MQKKLEKTRLLLIGCLFTVFWGGAASHANTLSVTNGKFSDINNRTETGGGWLGGVPAGWSTTVPASGYAIFQSGGTNYANLNTLGRSTNGFSPLRQTLGTVSSTSDVTISFKATALNTSPYYLASAIYSTADEVNPLVLFQTPALIQGPTTITYSARNVPADTQLFVAFWTLDGYAPGITDVTVSTSSVAAGIALNSGAVLEIDPTQPVSSSLNFDFASGSKIKVVGASAPTGSAVQLLHTSGVVSGAPVLEAAVSGYELALGGSNLLWLRKGLTVYNGDFQDTAGLTTNMAGLWYGGVPAGWEGAYGSFSVREFSGDRVANLNVLSTTSPFVALKQSAGLLDSSGIVTLSFDVADLSSWGYSMGAGIFNTNGSSNYSDWTALALPSGPITSAGRTTIETVTPIAAGTEIGVAFWASSGAPGIDNVALSITYANRAPAGISISGASISEINLVGDVVGTFSATDPDAGDTHDYSLVPGAGDGDNASFEIEGSTLKAKLVFDYEVKSSYSIRVRSTDAGGLTFEKTFTVTVTDVSEQTPQQAYLASFGLSGTDLLGTEDPDGDGINNNVEFAFGTNPANGAGEVIKTSASAGEFTIQWLQRVDGATSYTVQETGSLSSSWSVSSAVVQAGSGSTPPTGYEWKKITVPLSDRRFYRMNATLNP